MIPCRLVNRKHARMTCPTSSAARRSAFRVGAAAGLVVSAILAAPRTADAQLWAFTDRHYFDPLRAEVRGAQISVLFPARSDQFEFSPNSSDHFWGWDIGLGSEIPLLGWESQTANTDDLPPGGVGLGLWLPISFHMIEDLQGPSSPIVNTDYRFSLMLKAQYKLRQRWGFQLRIAGGHESTHLGDEFALLAFRASPAGFRRVNVSYEWIDAGLSLQHVRSLRWFGQSELLARLTKLWPRGQNYYSVDLPESGGAPVTPSDGSHQWGWGLQLVPDRTKRPWVSIEVRNRVVYGYDRAREEKEETKWSCNIMVGTRLFHYDYQSGGVEPFIRFYQGVNPAGQFRNDDHYTIVGLGLLVRTGGR